MSPVVVRNHIYGPLVDRLVQETPFYFCGSTNAASIVLALNCKQHLGASADEGGEEAGEERRAAAESLRDGGLFPMKISENNHEINPLKATRLKPLVLYLIHNLDMAVI